MDRHDPAQRISSGTRTTRRLAARAAAGDVDAERVLHDNLRPWLLGQLQKRQPPRAIDLDDVVQEAFLGMFRRLGDLVVDPDASVRGLLLEIGKRRLVDAVRRRTRGVRKHGVALDERGTDGGVADVADPAAPRPSGSARCAELLARLTAVLPKLTERRRELVRLFLLEGRSREEVMAALGLTDTAFRSALSHVRDQLEALLGLSRPPAR